MASELTNLSPITVGGEDLPTPQLFYNIPMLYRVLEEVVEDWMRAVEPYQIHIVSQIASAKMRRVHRAFWLSSPSFVLGLIILAWGSVRS